MPRNNYEDEGDTDNTLTNAYGLAVQIERNLENLELDSAETSLDVNLGIYGSATEVEYTLETAEWYEREIGEEYAASTEENYIIDPEDENLVADEEIIESLLLDIFESSLRLNGRVVRESPSPEYNDF